MLTYDEYKQTGFDKQAEILFLLNKIGQEK